MDLGEFKAWLGNQNPDQSEFQQAVMEVYADIAPLLTERHRADAVLKRLASSDRIISFRVCWEDDAGKVRVNRGWRVQHCGALGPYKGGTRFHPTVNESILKFLAFEQTFKNALTGLQMGAGKGGADFDPRGCSDREVMRFCQAYMTELHRYIGDTVDVPAGDINVGQREIGYMFGQYRRITNHFTGVLTGKAASYGGSLVRAEATGHGLVYFLCNMLSHQEQSLEGKRVAISGAGNVALHAAQKVIELGGTVICLSNSVGVFHNAKGIGAEVVDRLIADPDLGLKQQAEDGEGKWAQGESSWQQVCDVAIPCATQNELDESAAKRLVENGVRWVVEGANMPCTQKAIEVFEDEQIVHAPGKASNAGGVALSGLEMAQNATFESWSRKRLDQKLMDIMSHIHDQCLSEHNQNEAIINYRQCANRASFRRVADAVSSQGLI